MEIETKDATIQPTGADDDFPGSFEVILSAPTKDRDGDILLPEDWEQPLPEHITFDQDHAMTVAGTVGSGTPHIDPITGELKVAGTYSSLQRAQDVRTLVREKHIRTVSVAFMSKPAETKDGTPHKIRELLNGAFVAIPSNREALVLASKAFEDKAGARNSKTDKAHIQAIHDHATHLGAEHGLDAHLQAEADMAKAARANRTKAIVGSLEATQDRVRDALEDAYPDGYPCLRGTLDGTCVYDLTDTRTWERETFRQTFDDDGSVVTLTGTPEAVDIMEIVTPDADAATEPAEVFTASASNVSPPEPGTEESKAARSAEVDPPPDEGARSTEAVTPADEDAEMQGWAALLRTYHRYATAPERG